jgi:peptidoglycan/LPS O-acetylase OafA/YrhL
MEMFLQCWGGAGYFFSKVFIVRAEFLENHRNCRLIGLILYLLGMPAWIILFISRQNWMAAATEAAGIPALIFGIVMTWKQSYNPNKNIDWIIRIFTCLMILSGVAYSIYIFNGISKLSQVLEIIIIVTVLSSNYLLAKKNPYTWLTFSAALIATSILMYIQDKPILCIQQLVSLIPVIIGFIKCMKKARDNGH